MTPPPAPPTTEHGSHAKAGAAGRIRRYFIAGLLVITPIWGTYLILKTLLVTMERILGERLGGVMESYGAHYVPGFGILLLLLLILLVGIFATNIAGKKLFSLWEKCLNQVPLVRSVYSMVKSIVDTVSAQSGNKESFRRVVLMEYPRKGLYTYAFVTGEARGSLKALSEERVISVFVPTVPNPVSGFIILVRESETIPLTISVEDGMKLVFSVGLYSPPLHLDETRRPQLMEQQ